MFKRVEFRHALLMIIIVMFASFLFLWQYVDEGSITTSTTSGYAYRNVPAVAGKAYYVATESFVPVRTPDYVTFKGYQ